PRRDMAYTTVRAPISGRTGSVLVHLGNVVKAGDEQPLVVINRIDPIFATFSVAEQRLTPVRAAPGTGPARRGGVGGGRSAARPGRAVDLHRQPGRPGERHAQAEGHVRERGEAPVAGPVRERAAHAGRPPRRGRDPFGGGAAGAEGQLRL